MKAIKKLFSKHKHDDKDHVCTCKHGHCECMQKQIRRFMKKIFWGKHSSH